jgi:hypothetical protein
MNCDGDFVIFLWASGELAKPGFLLEIRENPKLQKKSLKTLVPGGIVRYSRN